MKMKKLGMLVAAGLIVSTSWLVGQDKATPKAKGQLPMYWKSLGLSDEQKQKVYEIQNATKAKTDELESKIKELKEAEKKDLEKVLTPAQKARLREIMVGKAPADDSKEKKDSKDKN